MSKIKNLEEDIKSPIVLYSQETNVLNPETGEYIPTRTTQVVKEHTRTGFIQVYTQNIDFLVNKDLSEMERRALVYSFGEMNYYNIIRIDSGLRSRIQIVTQLSQGSVSKAINKLIDKGIYIKIPLEQAKEFKIEAYTGKEYVINPNLVGKGSFKEMKNMRQTVVTNFDFETLTMKKEVSYGEEAFGLEEERQNLLMGKSEIKHISQSYDEKNNIQKTNITIADKEENKGDYSIVTVNPIKEEEHEKKSIEQAELIKEPIIEDKQQEKNIIEYEKDQQEERRRKIDLDFKNAAIREQEALNRAKELSIEDKKLEIELLKLRSKENKQGTLFGDEL